MIVAIYLLAMSAGAAIYLTQYLWVYFHPEPSLETIGPPPSFYILPPVVLIALSGLAAFMLLTDKEGSVVKLIQYFAIYMWTSVTLLLIFAALINAGEAQMKGFPFADYFLFYLIAYFLAGINGIMYFFLHECYTIRYSYQLKLRSPIGVISMASIGGLVSLVILYFLLLSIPSLSYSMTGHPPDSFLSEPVRASPEGKAFLAKYPDSKIIVDQWNLGHGLCCTVTLIHYRYSENSDKPRVELVTPVNITSANNGNPIAIIGEKRLHCYDRAGVWTVKGNIIHNLEKSQKDCWDIGPPSRPSDEQIIQMAKNTTAAKAYLAKYPDNVITVNGNVVTFTPTLSEPILLGVSFEGLDWNLSDLWIVCANGDYHYSHDSDFISYFQPVHSECLI